MNDVVTAQFDYRCLDDPGNNVRVRLNSTVVNVSHNGDPGRAQDCSITYVRGGSAQRVRAKQVVLACYNMAIPYICPDCRSPRKRRLPSWLKYQCVPNVLLNNWHAVKHWCGVCLLTGTLEQTLLLEFPVSMGDYRFASTPDDPIMFIACEV